MKATLLDLEMDLLRASDAVLALDDRLNSGEAVDASEYDAALVPFKESLNLAKTKRDNFANFLLQAKAQAELFGDRAALDTKRKKAIENLVARLEQLAAFAIRCADSNHLEGEYRTLQLHKNSQEALNIKHADMLPDSCFKTEVVRVIDKEAVRAGIKAGEIVPSVAELTRGEHLRIK
jgi:hypothetical protein